MGEPIKLISTDFDGTLFAEFEQPPVPLRLQNMIAQMQERGAKWVINTGRDLSSLMEALGRAHLSVKPDYLVLVEREIYAHEQSRYVEWTDWNRRCHAAHAKLFQHVRSDVPRLMAWVHERYNATVYEDLYSPFCLIADKAEHVAAIHTFLEEYCRQVPHLTVVSNDVYARFSHESFNKGSALAEIAGRLGLQAENTFAAGDHLNDLSMLNRNRAHWLAAPANAIEAVKTAVLSQQGFVSELPHGHGVAEGLEFHLRQSPGQSAKAAIMR